MWKCVLMPVWLSLARRAAILTSSARSRQVSRGSVTPEPQST